MKLRGIDFGHILDASGARNFDGKGWWYHPLCKPFGLDFNSATFVAKTTTLHPRKGNMPMKEDGITPKEYFPKCIKVNRRKNAALNAVGLSGPGLESLLNRGFWQEMTKPFFISFMAVNDNSPKDASETDRFLERKEQHIGAVKLLNKHLPNFKAPVGCQINLSCPTAGIKPRPEVDFICECHEISDIWAELKIPKMFKFSVTTSPETAMKIAEHLDCDAICVSNTIPWGALPDRINWKELFGAESPLKEFGGGGLSGAPLLPLVREWIGQIRKLGFKKPINAGGGIMSIDDVNELWRHGASSMFLGSVAFLDPTRVKGIIEHTNWLFENRGEYSYPVR